MAHLTYAALLAAAAALAWFAFEKSRRKTHPVTGGIQRSRQIPHSEPVELYSNSFSHCSRKARLVLAELGIPYRHHPIELIETGWYQTASRAYLAINPAGVVPTLVHRGHPVYESDDILIYAQSIAAADAPQLVPDDPTAKAQMEAWLSFCAIVSADLMGGMQTRAGACIPGLSLPMFMAGIRYTPLRRILTGFLFHYTLKSPAMFTAFKLLGLRGMIRIKPLRQLIHKSRDHMQAHLETLNRELAHDEREWMVGGAFSLADVSIGCMLLRLEEAGWLRWYARSASIPALLRYFERIKARPSWQQAILGHAHPVVSAAQEDLLALTTADPALRKLLYGAPGNVGESNKDALAW